MQAQENLEVNFLALRRALTTTKPYLGFPAAALDQRKSQEPQGSWAQCRVHIPEAGVLGPETPCSLHLGGGGGVAGMGVG